MTSRAVRNAYLRRQSLARRDLLRGLYWTHSLDGPSTTLDTDDLFPDLTRPITFGTRIRVSGASATGIVFEFGDTTTGTKLGVSGGSLYLAAGSAGTAADGVDDSVALDALGVSGATLDIVVAINPALGRAWLWVDGDRKMRLTSTSGDFTNDRWAAAGSTGSLGDEDSADGSTQRPGATINGAPSDFDVVAPLIVAVGQLPWMAV